MIADCDPVRLDAQTKWTSKRVLLGAQRRRLEAEIVIRRSAN